MSRMRVVLLVLTGLLGTGAVLAGPAADSAATTTRTKALRDGWPDTPAGLIGYGWVDAFARGEQEMGAFYAAHLPAEALAKRPLKDRLANYQKLRDRYGALELTEVVESKRTELTVRLLAEDATRHTFVFTVEKEAPHRLVSVSIREPHAGHGFGHH